MNPSNQKDNLKLSPVVVNKVLIPGLIPTGFWVRLERLECVSQRASSPAIEKGQHINYKNAF